MERDDIDDWGMAVNEIHETFLETARTAAREAADLLRKNFRGSYDVEYKQGGDPVTEIDLDSERLIRGIIDDRHPEHAIRSEEFGRDGDSRFTWIVDPLDGTANYVNGFGHYCVSIALVRDNGPIVGVVARPQYSDCYSAVVGSGAWCNDAPISISGTESVAESSVLVGTSPPIADDRQFMRTVARLMESDRSAGVRRLGSGACDLSLVARGFFDCFLDKYTSPWDVAAGNLLVTEAGGRVTDWNGDPIDLTARERDVHVLASNGRIHEQLQTIYHTTGSNPRPE